MSRVQRNVIFTNKIFLEYFQLQQLDTDVIQSKPGVKSVSFAKDSALAQLGPNYYSWFHHISKSQNKISSAIILDLIITSPKVKTKLQVPMCEKLRTQMYRENNSIHIFNIQFSFEPLMMMDLCKIWKLWNRNSFTISRSTALLQSGALIGKSAESGTFWLLPAPKCPILHFTISLHLIYLGPLQNNAAIILLF